MTLPLTAARWEDALRQEGCGACRLLAGGSRRLLENILVGGKTHAEVFDRLRASWGFCGEHARQLLGLAPRVWDGVGITVLYGWLLDEVMGRLDTPERGTRSADGWGRVLGRSGRPAAGLARRLEAGAACFACERRAEYEKGALAILADLLAPACGDPEVRKAFEAAEPLCLTHLRSLLALTESDPTAAWIIEAQAAKLRLLSADLKEHLRKHEAQHRHEPFVGGEEDAWIRVVMAVAGAAGEAESAPNAQEEPARRTGDAEGTPDALVR